MRFNKAELLVLACHPSHDFNKEGILKFFEKQDSFFRKNEVCVERWCRLRGNLFFYFKNSDHCSDPVGIFVLENFHLIEDEKPGIAFSFTLVFEEGSHLLAASTESDKVSWIEFLKKASFSFMRMQIDNLLSRISPNVLKSLSLENYRSSTGASIDFKNPPFLEMSISCDNLRCDGDGMPPNPRVCVYILKPPHNTWILYAQTEIQQRTSNPSFLTTISFRETDGVDSDTQMCLIVCDVRERVSDTFIHLGKTMLTIQALIDVGRTRLFLLSPEKHTVGFITLNTWLLHSNNTGRQFNNHATPKHLMTTKPAQPFSHRRTQSLPPKLNNQGLLPTDCHLSLFYSNPIIRTYRFHSGLGGDISVNEIMAEPNICYRFPQQLLRLWINEEKLQQEEILSLGDLVVDWNECQTALLNQHSALINMYGIALDSLEANAQAGLNFRKSAEKEESYLEFAPINLHLQRLWAANDSLRRAEHFDLFTVGAFSANSLGYKKGGLLHMLQSANSSRRLSLEEDRVRITEGIIDILRRMRGEIIILLRLLLLALRNKNSSTLIHIITQLQEKIHLLLQILDVSLVDKAVTFLESVRTPQNPPQALTFASREYSSHSLSEYLSPEKALDLELESPSVHDVFDKADHSRKSLDEVLSPSSTTYKAKLEEGLSEFCMNSCYRSTDEPEPWDLIHLNIKASLICLSSKIKSFCHKLSDDSLSDKSETDGVVSASSQPTKIEAEAVDPVSINKDPSVKADNPSTPDVSPCEDDSGIDVGRNSSEIECVGSESEGNISVEENNRLELSTATPATHTKLYSQKPLSLNISLGKKVEEDWMAEVRPSMRKLRQAIDGLMRTARLTHSVFCLQEQKDDREFRHSVKYRRRICFSQALTSVVVGLLTKIWCSQDSSFISLLSKLGPLVEFEVLLSCFKNDAGRLADMVVAVEDLGTVDFILVPAGVLLTSKSQQKYRDNLRRQIPLPRVAGTRSSLRVILPVPEQFLSLISCANADHPSDPPSFKITPVLFNVGINEEATLSSKLRKDAPQHANNIDSFERLHRYYNKYKKIFNIDASRRHTLSGAKPVENSLSELISTLHEEVCSERSKNVSVLQLASKICRMMGGLRFTSCKSAKDRTGMSATLEEATILKNDFDLAETEFQLALNCLRTEGTRRLNCRKNTGSKNYAFSSIQVKFLPELYKPPPGSFGSNVT